MEQRRISKRRAMQRRAQRQFKYDGLVEYSIDLLIERSEYACAAADVRGAR